MAKKRTASAQDTTASESPDVFDTAIAAQQTADAARQTQHLIEQTAAAPAMPTVNDQPPTQTYAPRKTYKPRTTIAVPFSDGSVARHFDDGNWDGVSIRIDHPDETFRPSAQVNEPLKEEHEGRNKMRWDQGRWRKHVRNNPVGERLDAENRFEEMVSRRQAELEGSEQER